jgi:ferredoxin
MSTNAFVSSLDKHDDKAWATVLTALEPSIHEVDRAATRIWFAFFPLVIARAFAETDDAARLAQRLQVQGRYLLSEQIDTSHAFLYGHRYWPDVKRAVAEYAKAIPASDGSLEERIREIATSVASKLKAEASLTLGITAVAFMTLQQVGLDAFAAAPGSVDVGREFAAMSPKDVLRAREKGAKGGLLGLLRSVDTRYTVTFDETKPGCTFESIKGQDLSSAGATDTRDYKSKDPRRVEGPIPVECRTAACGTCWIGVIAGADKLSEVDDREWRKMKEFGYLDTDDPKPVVRLACRAKAHGSVTIVVPPWNGVFGKLVEGKIAVKEEPVLHE